MALKFSTDAQVMFFSKVFGSSSVVTQQAKALVAAGTKFDVSLYSVSAVLNGTPNTIQLTMGTPTLMKGEGPAALVDKNTNAIAIWMADLHSAAGFPATPPATPVSVWSDPAPAPVTIKVIGVGADANKIVVIKAIRVATGWSLYEAKQLSDQLFAGVGLPKAIPLIVSETQAINVLLAAGVSVQGSPVVVASLGIAKPVPEVIDLKAAQALGQKVHGTSTGSVYYTIAVGADVKVAARVQGTSISLRAEWTGNPQDELKKLAEMGMQMKSGYASWHFDANTVPVPRVIGAFLMGAGIAWKAAVLNGGELVTA